MKRAGFIVSLLAFLSLLSVTVCWAASPKIVSVEVTRSALSWPEASGPAQSWADSISVVLEDADGVADLATLRLAAPGAYEVTAAVGLWPFVWTTLNDTQVKAEWYLDSGAAVPEGAYSVTVEDQGGEQDALTTVSVPEATGLLPTPLFPAPQFSQVTGTDVTFQWAAGSPEAVNTVWVGADLRGALWERACGSAESVAYNDDGTAQEPLRAGHSYGWSTTSRLAVTDPDPRVTITREGAATGAFVLLSDSPVVEYLDFVFDSRTDSLGAQYAQHYCHPVVLVTDSRGSDQIASVALVEPSGVSHELLVQTQIDPYLAVALLPPFLLTPPVGPASYTVSITDGSGHTTSYATPALGPSALEASAPAPGAVITDLTPTFAWGGEATATPSIYLLEEGRGFVWGALALAGGQVAYNSDGNAEEPALACGHTYYWSLDDTFTPESSDPRVRVTQFRTATSIFTEYEELPARPELAGKLAYSLSLGTTGAGWPGPWLIQGYNPDPSIRTWWGPTEATAPTWSPDGSKLMYLKDGRIWIDSLDGTPPTVFPQSLEYPAQIIDCKWAPDGEHIVFTVVDYYNGYPQSVWVSNSDGGEATPIASSPDFNQRFPDWSPDGGWIAYRSFSGEGQGVSIMRPDGTEAHPLFGTTLEGYPGVTVDYLDMPSWSPDSRHLAVVFGGKTSEGADIGGIGTISRDGGPVQPVFISPNDHPCCASAKMPTWSPDGQSIVFVSAHHMPVNDQWGSGYFEAGTEVWMVDADGTGEPVRLTYDYGFNTNPTWWMKKVFRDVCESYWAYDAIGACHDAGLVAGYQDGTFQPESFISRDQLAVYLARALAGGDANVPDPTGDPSFQDVPREYWAFKYIEYCKAHDVIAGDSSRYHPEALVNRGQIAMYVARAIAPESERPDLPSYVPPATPSFPDVPTNDPKYKYIEYCHEHGVVNGYADGYHPERRVTRAQLAVFVARGFKLPGI